MQIIWNYPELDRLLKSRAGPVGRDLHRRGLKVATAAKRQVGVKTGALKSSIEITHGRNPTGQQVMVGSDLDYALMHHEGTRPHVIIARPEKLLRFTGRNGGVVYTNKVNHPGTRANKYLTDNMYLVLV